MVDHSHIDTVLDIVEVTNLPATLDVTKLYYRTGDGLYFRPLSTTVSIPLLEVHGYVYERSALQKLVRGDKPLIATSPALSTTAPDYGVAYDHASWTISAYATALGISTGASATAERLYFPVKLPPNYIGLMAQAYVGTTEGGSLFIPYGGFAQYIATNGPGGATIVTSPHATAQRLALMQTDTLVAGGSGGNGWWVQIHGAGTVQPAATTIRIYGVLS